MKHIKKLILDIILISLIMPIFILGIWCCTNSWPYPNLLPQKYSTRGFEYIFNITNLNILMNSIIISLVIVFITIMISTPAAKAITVYKFKGKKFFELLILSPIIIPMVSVAMGIHTTFIRLGLANNILGVIIINIVPCVPYAVRIIGDVYKLVGDKLELQAQLLGASKFNTFRYITLPLILPGIIGASSMCFIISFSQYFLTMLIGGGNITTYTMIMFPYIQSGDRNLSALYSMVFLIVSIVVLMLMENRIKKYYINNSKSSYLM